VARVVILGAGLTGLSSAYHFEKNNFFDYKLFEANSTVGGLCSSVHHAGFTFDYTGHLLHINDSYFKDFLEDVTELDRFNKIQRNSYVYSHNTYTTYPFQMNLYGLPIDVIVECIEGFLKRKQSLRSPQNLYDWVVKHFGAGIGKYFLFPYNEKILSYDIKKVHPSWTGRFVPSTTLKDILYGALERKKSTAGYNSSFYYPYKGGIQFLPNAIEKKIKNTIHTHHRAQKIDTRKKVIIFENGHVEPYETLITTAPLDTLLSMVYETKTTFKRALPHLQCNSVMNFNIGVNKEDLTNKHWIYFPEKRYPFYRLGFWSSFSPHMTPQGCSSLYGEVSYLPQKKMRKSLEAIKQQAIENTLHLLGLTREHVVAQKTLHLKHAYVIYTAWRHKNLKKLHLELVENTIHSIGRFGEWKYSSMQEAVLDGKDVAGKILSNKARFYGAHKESIQVPRPVEKKKKRDELQR